MKPKAFRIAFQRKSRLGMILSLALVCSLLTPMAPAAFGAGRAGAPIPVARAAVNPSALVAPSITATKSDSFPDPDNDGNAAPGATITYTVQITNNGGSDATGVVFNDTIDANTTLVPGSITTTPVAIDDTYSAIGNVQINVPAANGLTSNDSDPDGGPIAANAGSSTSANGGNVTVNADGSFTYNPPPGFEGADTFTYSVAGASSPSNTATVTVNVSGMIWFVDASASAGGDGRLTSPFNALTGPGSFDAVAADQANDNIFLYSGPYTGGLSLLSGQALIGQGASASLSAITGLTPPSYSAPLPATGGSNPVIGGSTGITVATNNLIRGVNIANTGGTGISGSAFGTLAVAETAVSTTGGPALNLDNGLLNTDFQSLGSTNSGSTGVSLTNIAMNSTFVAGATTVNGASGVGVFINNVGGGSSVTFGQTDILNRSNTGVDLNNVAGTLAFGATTIPNPNSSTGYGIHLTNSAAAVTFGSATISDTKLTTAQIDANADLIPDNDGNGDAIFIKNNTGSFAVNGGVISNTDNDGIDVRNSSNVSLTGLAINNPGVTASGASGTGGHGIQAINLSGTNSLTSVNISGFNASGRDGVRLINNAAAAMTMTVSAGTFSNSTSTGSGINILGRDNANMSLVVNGTSTFQNLFGPAIAHVAGVNANSTATVNLTVDNSTFQNAPLNGQNTVQASVTQGGKATIATTNNTFNNVARTVLDTSGVIDINGNGTLAGNSLSFTATNNNITNIGSNTAGSCGTLPCSSRRGIDVALADNTSVSGTIVIDGNQITDVKRTGIIFDIGSNYNGSNVALKVTNNTVGTNALRVGTTGAGEIGINVQNRNPNGKGLNLNLSGNTVRNGNGGAGSALNTPGVFLRAQNTATMDATLTGNDIETSTSGVVAELRVDTTTNTPTLCLDANGNILDAGNGRIAVNRNNGTLNVEQASAAALASANGIPAANVTTAGSPTFGVTCANPPLVFFRTAAPREYLAALDAPAAKATQGFSHRSGARTNVLAGIMSGPDAGRMNLKQALSGHSYRNSEQGNTLGTTATDPFVRPARKVEAPAATANAAALAPLFSGETVNVNVGTLPAGKSMTITFQATINNPFNASQASNQGTVSGTNFSNVLTDDPATAAPNDPTVTPVGTPPSISCPANITTGTDPGQFSASVSFNVTATGTPAPTVDCKVGATSITSPHTFPVGTTTVQCTATNGVGSPASCSFNVTVNDTQTPTISCPANIVTTTAPNSCDATVNVGTPTVNDNDPNVATNGVRSDAQPLNAPYPKGTTTITWTATDTAGNSASCQQTVTVSDGTAPVITLNGSATMTVECHTSFTDPGATASDNCDNSVAVNVSGSVNVNAPGSYTLTYSATDSSGNAAAPVTRTVNVVDTIAPIITLNGASSMTVECHTSFSDPGATASDTCDTSVPVNVSGSVNVNVPGTYTLTYNASDDSGNAATPKTRTVTVVDTIAPVITVNGPNPMTVECHTTFTDPGATASDSCDTNVPVTTTGSVNANVPGTYVLTYNASDDSGNNATPKTRTVIVVDSGAPVITVNSLAPSLWPANHKYVSFNVTDFVTGVTDSCSTSLGVSSVVVQKITSDEIENGNGDGNTLNDIVIAPNCKSFQLRAERDGSADGRVYTVTFAVKDASGNVGTQTVKIVVPKNPGQTPVDSGAHYTVNGSCGP
ncbi:MAG: DUF5011 domain-containing protein [Acidobacteria bacterium]|nr:DUF5011 domain-containing protein [Acidobacteriota bacterium]